MNQLDLNGRVAIVTGGAQGIGYASAERMLLSGASVVLWDIDAALLARAGEALAALGTVATAVVELTDADAVEAATARAASSARMTPLMTSGPFQIERSQARSSQVTPGSIRFVM